MGVVLRVVGGGSVVEEGVVVVNHTFQILRQVSHFLPLLQLVVLEGRQVHIIFPLLDEDEDLEGVDNLDLDLAHRLTLSLLYRV